MTDTELEALEAAAKAATPGPWEAWNSGEPFLVVKENVSDDDVDVIADCRQKDSVDGMANAAYIAAANPDVVIRLIAELRQAKELCKEHELYIAELEQSGKIYDKKIGKLSKLLGIEHEEGNYSELVCIYQFVELLQKELRQARAKLDYLAEVLWIETGSMEYYE